MERGREGRKGEKVRGRKGGRGERWGREGGNTPFSTGPGYGTEMDAREKWPLSSPPRCLSLGYVKATSPILLETPQKFLYILLMHLYACKGPIEAR